MSDTAPEAVDPYIRDERGQVTGEWRPGQIDAPRVHPVPLVDRSGAPVMEMVPDLDSSGGAQYDADGAVLLTERQAVQMLPLDDPRAAAQLEAEGLQVDGVALVAIPGHPLTDPAPEGASGDPEPTPTE